MYRFKNSRPIYNVVPKNPAVDGSVGIEVNTESIVKSSLSSLIRAVQTPLVASFPLSYKNNLLIIKSL